MSMLSAQCDELRIMANISELPDGVRLALRQAADTIWELRCKLNDEQDENVRLRSCLTDAAENARLIMGENAKLRRDLEEANSQAEEVCIENAKLRELVRDWYALATGGADSLTDWNHSQADLEHRMRELGVVE